ncbi:Mitogen-activated protein kinase kinase kinase like protein [Argiope bruennichi]|uniref:non-specific serine/threonine protein kinase n=1 Tax=Argiope bruennichi TaxID=94029 RepID=A0A8T0EUG0_ARGBR|nr:Mitogen-activated protein kinase kinase kinase like protein [Argiope bruennichi]
MKPSELKSFLKFEGSYNYSLKRFIDIGHFRAALLLQDNVLKEDVLGKIVGDYNEGEFIQWPHLRHENVILLLDMVPLSYQKTIFIFTLFEKTIRTAVKDANFKFHPKCFDRKRSYAKDVLCGLEYLHQKSLSLMNLNDENVLISRQNDKAVISDLSCCTSAKTAKKANYPVMFENLFPPEADDGCEFECMQFDIWSCGVMFLQVFTMYMLPWRQVPETDYLEGLTAKLLRQTNPGSYLPDKMVSSLKDFLASIFQKDPKLRVSAKAALASDFLQSSGKRIDEKARDFWKACETEKLMSDGKFEKVEMYYGTGDIYWKRKDHNYMTAKQMPHFTDIKLKKSKSNNELCVTAKESNSEMNSSYEVTSRNRSNEILPLRNSLLKKTSYSEENLYDFYSWTYDKASTIGGYNVAKKGKQKEVKSKGEINDKKIQSLNTTEEIMRNLNSEDTYKCCIKEKYFEVSNSTFDLPCRCVFCTGTFDNQKSLNFLQFWPLPAISTINYTHSKEQPSTTPFCQTQGGFLHNNWKAERSYITKKRGPDLVKDDSAKYLNLEHLQNSWNIECNNRSEKLKLQIAPPVNITWPRKIENHKNISELPILKVYPDSSFTSGENQLMFQRCTGFRNGPKFRTPLHSPPPMIIAKSALSTFQNEEKTPKEINQLNSDRKIPDVANNRASDMNCIEKGNTFKKEKDPGENVARIDPRVVMETRHEENQVIDVSMDLPLCSVNVEKGKSSKGAFRDKPKQKWIRVLCPGSILEEKTDAQEIENKK